MNAAEHRAAAEALILGAAGEISEEARQDRLTALVHATLAASLPTAPDGYFIAPNAWGDPCVWQERPASPSSPLAVLRAEGVLAAADNPLWGFLASVLPHRDQP